MKTITLIGLVIIAMVLGSGILLAVLNPWLPEWACTSLGQHRGPRTQGFDGISFNGCCPRCGKHVLQDSQGNWF